MAEVPSIAIFMFCLIGCGCQSYFLGKRYGVDITLLYLHEQGIIELEDHRDE